MKHKSHTASLQYVTYLTHSDVRIFYSPPVVYAHTKCRKYEIRAHPSPHWWHRYYVLCKGLYQLSLHIKARGCCHWHKPFKCGWPAEYLVKVGKHPSCHSQKKVPLQTLLTKQQHSALSSQGRHTVLSHIPALYTS